MLSTAAECNRSIYLRHIVLGVTCIFYIIGPFFSTNYPRTQFEVIIVVTRHNMITDFLSSWIVLFSIRSLNAVLMLLIYYLAVQIRL